MEIGIISPPDNRPSNERLPTLSIPRLQREHAKKMQHVGSLWGIVQKSGVKGPGPIEPPSLMMAFSLCQGIVGFHLVSLLTSQPRHQYTHP